MLSAHAHAAWADQIKNATYALHSGGPARDGSGSAMVSLDRSIAETLAHALALAGTTRLSSQMLRSKPEHRVIRDCKELHHRRR
jgi:hypothetical protein